MENNENKKTPEALADEALDKVAGGGGPCRENTCPGCQEDKTLRLYHDPANPFTTVDWMCADCARKNGYVL